MKILCWFFLIPKPKGSICKIEPGRELLKKIAEQGQKIAELEKTNEDHQKQIDELRKMIQEK
jgi:hypothetical protein